MSDLLIFLYPVAHNLPLVKPNKKYDKLYLYLLYQAVMTDGEKTDIIMIFVENFPDFLKIWWGCQRRI